MRTLTEDEARLLEDELGCGPREEISDHDRAIVDGLEARGLIRWSDWYREGDWEYRDIVVLPLGRLALTCYLAARVQVAA